MSTTASSGNERTALWQPPERPEWVQRINEEGACMNLDGVVPFDAESFISSAQRATGLTDFGDDDWREPFQIIVKAMVDEADLNLIGRLRTRSEILQLLEARLQIEDWYSRHPEIDDEVVSSPIFIVGQGRSGTSVLCNVLDALPGHIAPKHWEMIFPCPPPEAASYHTDERIARGHAAIDQWNRVTPTIASMHEFGGEVPMECTQILGLGFRSSTWFDSLGQVPSYQMWLAQQDPQIALAYHERVLKLLQWRNPRRHWVLKDPMHLDRMPALLERYPDARFVWPHRDPTRALASTVSLLGTVQWGRTDHPFQFGAFEYVTNPDLTAGRFNAVIEQLDAGAIPEDRIHHMLYSDLVTDPKAAIEAMYAHLGLELTDAHRDTIDRYMAEHPREARPAHKLDLGPEELNSRDRQAFARYQERFGIPYE
jgi:Sulfotransferase family